MFDHVPFLDPHKLLVIKIAKSYCPYGGLKQHKRQDCYSNQFHEFFYSLPTECPSPLFLQ